jgi:hypothetical protein
MSSIVGAIFMILIAGSLASAYFFYTLSQNDVYNLAVKQQNQLDFARLSETAQASNTTYEINTNGYVSVKSQIQNTGSSPINFVTIWTCASVNGWSNYNFTTLNVIVPAGGAYSVNLNVAIAGVATTNSYAVTSWLITSRGNTVALPKQLAITNGVLISQTTQGIGSLIMNFQNFYYYKISSGTVNFASQASGYYVNSVDAPLAFRVEITNLNTTSDIKLDRNSEFFSILPFTGGAYQAITWYIVNVNSTTGQISNTYTDVTLPHLSSAGPVPVLVYFASEVPVQNTFTPLPVNRMATGTCPVNLALVGTIGGTRFGQNIPFVSILVS